MNHSGWSWRGQAERRAVAAAKTTTSRRMGGRLLSWPWPGLLQPNPTTHAEAQAGSLGGWGGFNASEEPLTDTGMDLILLESF